MGCSSPSLTAGLGEILVELLAVLIVDDVVDAGVDQLLLLVLQVLRHVVRHEHDAALSVDHKQEAVQGLSEKHTPKKKKSLYSAVSISIEPSNDGDACKQACMHALGPQPPPFSHCPQADLQQQRPQMVFVNDPLTSRGHIRLLDVVIAASALSCGQTEHITTLTGTKCFRVLFMCSFCSW